MHLKNREGHRASVHKLSRERKEGSLGNRTDGGKQAPPSHLEGSKLHVFFLTDSALKHQGAIYVSVYIDYTMCRVILPMFYV